MVELIITEKPSSAQKVAEALSDGKPVKKGTKDCSYYEITHNKKKIFIASAVGHLYGLVEKDKKGWTYPIFEIEWKANYKTSEDLSYTKKYVDMIESLAKKADEFTIACDYDVEGEVIGLNIIRFTCKQKDANRMKFSTLTKPDLIEAYEKKFKHLDWGQATAGETRNMLDWFYGINLSRALTSSVKAAGSFKVMSVGRVQGPALKLLVDREKEINNFKPEPFWEINLNGLLKSSKIEASHTKGKIFDKKTAHDIFNRIKDHQEAVVTEVKKSKREQAPPYPFDLTTLQTESYSQFKITPRETLAIAQSLYLAGVTSYPRTSSQQLDPKLGFKNILTHLSKQSEYKPFCDELLKLKELRPNNGKKTDPAHPAIYPTGIVPKSLKPRDKKVYDLIVRRFLATFSSPAIRETVEALLNVKNEPFVARGTRTITENWHKFYKPYLNVEELTLPEMKENDTIKVKEITKEDKETQPPNRFNQSSIIRELEKRKLGTKATRADILHRLFERGYIDGVQIKVSDFGMETIRVLDKHAPLIVDEKLTAEFEDDMEEIREGKEKPEKVLEKAKKVIIKISSDFQNKEKIIGKELLESIQKTREVQNYIGKCMSCENGKLSIRFGKFGKFIACDKYPDCKTTFKLPKTGMISNLEQVCPACEYPKIKLIQKGKRPREFCINPNCKTKINPEEKKEIKELEHHHIEKKCPACGKPLLLRKSFYGAFLGCSGYPQCKHTENLENSKFKKKEEK